ncbi:MAG TPA: thiamine pyrophosphate-binding protein [Miltoncostaeaceae bacterium]|nr:thiamine pyrophosphate-binding protein [Miltoncostaeaceae bacterium]
MAPGTRPPRTLGEHLIDALARRGVRHVFGVPGDFILGLFRTGADRGMTMVNSTREEAAVYAAGGSRASAASAPPRSPSGWALWPAPRRWAGRTPGACPSC